MEEEIEEKIKDKIIHRIVTNRKYATYFVDGTLNIDFDEYGYGMSIDYRECSAQDMIDFEKDMKYEYRLWKKEEYYRKDIGVL